ncbi:ribosomal protein S6 kinase beta-like isoform X2 [Littorina saxatilis]|uniref:ribosomal protein S6 kinase beta-like isoform X2 n=1 Tax=Littorina saxatilis TaxID=31220 RepID=UPI0038B5A1E9
MSSGVSSETSSRLATTLSLPGTYTQDCHPDQDKTVPPTPEMIFRFAKELGHGSFGKVKLVELKVTGERLAMKIMDKKECPKALRTKELHAFIQVGVSPFIVRYHSCFQTDTACYLLMQFHCGGSLAKIIEEFGLLCEATSRFFTAEVVEGLLHLHRRGIVHRDIKLANILLGVDNHVRICDLGLCKLGMTGKSRTHTRCGALRYCAPEVLAREWYSKEVDWWSLGVVLFRMLTGQYPFDAESREAIEDLIKNEEPNMTLLPPGPAEDIIRQFLKKKAEDRLGSGEYAASLIRQHAFFKDLNWDQLQARTAKAPSVQKRFMRRGSIIRKLAFGADDPDASPLATVLRRTIQFLVRLFIMAVFVFCVVMVARPDLKEWVTVEVEHYIERYKQGANT